MLTDGRRVSVINAPAGSGKTWVLTAVGQTWTAVGLGRVIGITPSQSSRNTLAAGVPESYNSAQFLGHIPGQRGARGPIQLGPGDLVLTDEASMVSNPDLADVIGQAAGSGAKVILTGDTQQLQAVENGGGLSLLASALGFVQLSEPVRFRAAWEQAASLRLREGDTSVLAEYDQHARIRGGDPERMIDAAAADYLALTLDGTDVLLMAADHALRRELSRRIRDDLIRFGIVSHGPAIRIADGATASAGDLIVCTENDHSVQAGEPGRTLANGDLLRIDAVTGDGLIVRRALDADSRTGQRRWTCQQFLHAGYQNAELGYAVTDHAAQSRTVTAGLAVITGTEDRQHAYVALSRGTNTNRAYVFTVSPKLADSVPGPRPAPELARYDRITAEGSGKPAATQAGTQGALEVLAGVLERDGQQLSASQTWQRALVDADHLAVLHAIWTDQTTPARDQRYGELLLSYLPPGHRQEPGHQVRWLCRTLHAAELAGLDPGQLLIDAIGERDLVGARDIPSVIDARIRHRVGSLLPLPRGPWSARVPELADPERLAYLTQIAAMMDARKERIGEHAAEHTLPWAIKALGPVPEHPVDRLDWQRRASSIGAWRELSGHHGPADPIGPEPVAAAPEARVAWREAFMALAPVDGPAVRALPDGTLLHLRDTYPIETAWAPQWVGDELRQVRAAAWEAQLTALRADADARVAAARGPRPASARRESSSAGNQLSRSTRKVPGAGGGVRRGDGRQGRLGRRHPRPASPRVGRRCRDPPPLPRPEVHPAALGRTPPATLAQRDELTLTMGEQTAEMSQWIQNLTAQRQAFADKLADRQSQMVPADDPDYADLGPAFPAWPSSAPDAILQPPKPEIRPAQLILDRAADRDADWEAAD